MSGTRCQVNNFQCNKRANHSENHSAISCTTRDLQLFCNNDSPLVMPIPMHTQLTHSYMQPVVLIVRCYSDIYTRIYVVILYIVAHAAASCYILFKSNDQETVLVYTESKELTLVVTQYILQGIANCLIFGDLLYNAIDGILNWRFFSIYSGKKSMVIV